MDYFLYKIYDLINKLQFNIILQKILYIMHLKLIVCKFLPIITENFKNYLKHKFLLIIWYFNEIQSNQSVKYHS